MNPVDASFLVKEIKSGKPLPKWETDFMKSVESLIKSGRYLSTAQSKKLQEVYRRSQEGYSQSREYIR